MSQNDNVLIRTATINDLDTLVTHRSKMFEEMSEAESMGCTEESIHRMDVAYRTFLEKSMISQGSVCWIAEHQETPAGSAVLTITPWIPNPFNPSGEWVYLHSIYVEQVFRNGGIATRLINKAIDYCKTKRYYQIRLHTSEAGRMLYSRLGFVAARAMKLTLSE